MNRKSGIRVARGEGEGKGEGARVGESMSVIAPGYDSQHSPSAM